MPSQVRRVRAQLLGQLPEGVPADDDSHHRSLPLPARARPQNLQALPPRDATQTLPLRQQHTRRPPLYRLQRAMSAAAAPGGLAAGQQSGPASTASGHPPAALPSADGVAAQQEASSSSQQPATGAATLTQAAAAQLGQQLWHRLQIRRMQGLLRVSGGSAGATLGLAEGEQRQNGALQMAGGKAAQAGRQAGQEGGCLLTSKGWQSNSTVVPHVDLKCHAKQCMLHFPHTLPCLPLPTCAAPRGPATSGSIAGSVHTEDLLAAAVAAPDGEAARRQLFQLQSLAPRGMQSMMTSGARQGCFAGPGWQIALTGTA